MVFESNAVGLLLVLYACTQDTTAAWLFSRNTRKAIQVIAYCLLNLTVAIGAKVKLPFANTLPAEALSN